MTISSNVSKLATYVLVLAAIGVLIVILISPVFEDEATVAFALRLSAKLAFFVYALIFMARPLQQLFPTPVTQSLLRSRPFLGLSFAAVMSAHLALIAWWFVFVARESPPVTTLLIGGIAYAFIFLMAITTFAAPARVLGPQNWRRLHRTGLYFVGAVFLNALIPDVIAMPSDPVYLAAGIVMVIAITLRMTTFVKSRNQKTAAIESAR